MSTDAAKPAIRGLYAIADSAYLDAASFVPAVRAALDGGARVIQYRDKLAGAAARGESQGWSGHKHGTPAQRQAIAHELNRLCLERGVPLLINDDVALAAEIGAAGVHIGRDDPDLAAARRLLGDAAIIGVSCYNELGRAQAAVAAGADYVAFGRFFPSRTKPHAVQATSELLHIARETLRVPIVAIGGITPENGGALLAAGADALAVIEGVFGQPDIRAAAERYAALFS